MITLTLCNGMGNTKIMMSPYEDGEFIFANKKLKSLRESHAFLQRNYSLSRALDIQEPKKLPRNKKAFNNFIPERLDCIAINLTEISSKYMMDEVIEYFKEKNYACILTNGIDYNGTSNFHIQGLLKVDFLCNDGEETIKNALMIIQAELQEKARVDLFASSPISVQPPTNNSKILYIRENGNIIKNSEIRPVLNTVSTINTKHLNFNSAHSTHCTHYDDEFVEQCLEQFVALGFQPTSTSNTGPNKGINFSRKYGNNTKKGYIFYPDNPLIMFSTDKNNKKDQVSIYHLIKNTKEGKRYLKNKTKQEQANQLIKEENIQDYTRYLSVHEQYLDFTKYPKKKLVQEFMESKNGVFKLKSLMGSGKSAGIDLIIKEAHKRNEKVIIVSNRISVAKDFAEKYNLLLYQDPDSINSEDSIVVQYDSLYKYDLTNYDVAIFDEFVSLLLHHRSNLTTNSNINAVKFKILSDKKKVVIADAFLTGYELTFFKNREIYFLNNNYREDVKLFDYEQREFFITELIYNAQLLKEGEHISASFTSLNIIKLVEYELRKVGVKVIALTSETAETTRNIIYKKFKEKEHSSFQVILYTPTLTVGVSNINNVISHWHYDSSMGADVISSLQMIKRSRKAKEIHYFIQSRQNHYDTDLKSLNINAERNINQYYNSKDKTLLVDIDYETGNLVLTDLAKYINKIEAFYNILANNHANAFRLLLSYQFKNVPIAVQNVDHNYNIRENLDKIKKRIRENNIKILDEFGEIEYTEEEIQLIKNKTYQKTPEERVQLMLKSTQDKFSKKLPRDKLKELTKLELDSGGTFIQTIKNVNSVQKADGVSYSRYELSEAVSSDISSLQSRKHIKFLENLIKFNGNVLETSYSKLQVNEINQKLYDGKKKFEKFLGDLGYKWDKRTKTFNADVRVYSYIGYL